MKKLSCPRFIKRWYHLLVNREKCFKCTIAQRLHNRWDYVQYGDIYMGNDWWFRNKP